MLFQLKIYMSLQSDRWSHIYTENVATVLKMGLYIISKTPGTIHQLIRLKFEVYVAADTATTLENKSRVFLILCSSHK